MHRVGTNDQKISSALLNPPCTLRQHRSRCLPITGLLVFFNLGKIDTIQKDLCGMETACFRLHTFIDGTVIEQRGFPAHATQQTYRFQFCHLLAFTDVIGPTVSR